MSVNVEIIESERGWGQRVDEVKEFPTYEEAINFCKEYNDNYNTKNEVPDWYMYAQLEESDSLGMLR